MSDNRAVVEEATGYAPATLAELVHAVEEAADAYDEALAVSGDGALEASTVAGNKLKALVSAERNKVDAIARFLKMLQYQANVCEMEIEELKARHERLLKTYDRVSEFVIVVMEGYGYKKIEGNLHRITRMAGHTKVEIDPARVGEIPLTYMRTVPARYEPDKTAIKDALQGGAEIPGASLAVGRQYLRVYT